VRGQSGPQRRYGLPGGAGRYPESAGLDIRLAKENGILYLIAVNGVALSKPDASTSDCSGVTYGNDRIAVVGLGPGVDFCVRTKRGSVSHAFFTDDVREGKHCDSTVVRDAEAPLSNPAADRSRL
jgi:hypothetical protein